MHWVDSKEGGRKIYEIINTRLIHCYNTQSQIFWSLFIFRGHSTRPSLIHYSNNTQPHMFWSLFIFRGHSTCPRHTSDSLFQYTTSHVLEPIYIPRALNVSKTHAWFTVPIHNLTCFGAYLYSAGTQRVQDTRLIHYSNTQPHMFWSLFIFRGHSTCPRHTSGSLFQYTTSHVLEPIYIPRALSTGTCINTHRYSIPQWSRAWRDEISVPIPTCQCFVIVQH